MLVCLGDDLLGEIDACDGTVGYVFCKAARDAARPAANVENVEVGLEVREQKRAIQLCGAD